ncbi:MAG: 16S rRNA (cytosine(967)-C(5))-methyltransferase RsmB [Clostridiales bacterium]|jgi:16S rRNA (cytosine967-C5)-methyltransferase|nr:16S rRNA (cytosine(967)-C(5))-methyltransferase RsmB [Eubacteriales bacterium]MDH7566615.1 16S rRNA (cytosine(967)-C(5))-methyltransferase RsmB [Clostridiales bacterium]
MPVDLPREIALKILYDVNEKKAYSNIAINKYLEEYDLKGIDRAFITDMVYGTIKWKLAIDWVIEQFSSVKMKKISPWILNVLRLGAYQLLYTHKIPESAACNESVKLAGRYGHFASTGFVNAVLRSIAKNKGRIEYPDRDGDFSLYLSVKYSHPRWMVEEWIQQFGKEFTESLLISNNEVPDFTVRVNTLKISKAGLMESLKASGMEVEDGRYVPEAVVIKNPGSVSRLDEFKKGYFQVQDESSMLAAKVLDPKPGQLVMDVCSAPGGKATHMAELMKNQGIVVARDIHEHKVRLIKDSASRLGLNIIKTDVFDAAVVDERYVGKADRVLVDAPCSGLGIIRRKPDIKWARGAEDKKEILALQARILDASSRYVKPGGALVYSTCTIDGEENEEMVRKFVEANEGFQLDDISSSLPDSLPGQDIHNGYVQLFPNVHKTDGFFIAKIVKRG